MANEKPKEQLMDLDVERADGVDKPATRRKFMLFKSEDAGAASQVLKGYAQVATAAAEVLKSIRKDENAKVSLKSAIALNGLAQVLNQEPVFTAKSVPTQPYDFSEPDVNERGPADEKLGANFVARSAAEMVGKCTMKLKDADDAAAAGKGPKVAGMDDEAMDKEPKGMKPKKKDEDDDVADKKAAKSEITAEAIAAAVAKALAPTLEALGKSQGELTTAIKGAVAKGEGEETEEVAEPIKKAAAPKSKQAEGEEVVRVRKSGDRRMDGADFSNVVFGGK